MCNLQYYWHCCLVYMLKRTKTFSFTCSLKGFDASIWNEGFLFPSMKQFSPWGGGGRKKVQFEIESFNKIWWVFKAFCLDKDKKYLSIFTSCLFNYVKNVIQAFCGKLFLTFLLKYSIKYFELKFNSTTYIGKRSILSYVIMRTYT